LFFAKDIQNNKAPSHKAVEELQNKYTILKQRTISSIRSKVHLMGKQANKTDN